MLAYTFYEQDNRVRRYAEALAKRGDQVDAIALRRVGSALSEVIQGVNVFRIQARSIDETGPISYLWKLLAFFLRSAWFVTIRHLRNPYDIIHVHSVPDFEVFATLVPRILGARIILDIHDIVPEFYASKFKVDEKSLIFKLLVQIEKLSIRYSDRVIAANDLWHDKLVTRSVSHQKCITIINYPDLSIFSLNQREASIRGNFTMCYPGTLAWHQGVDLAIDAVSLLRDEVPNLRFVIIGDGPQRENLQRRIKERELCDRVEIRSGVAIERVAELMANVDLGVVPKRIDKFANEAFSTKVLEFMAMRVPVLAARTKIDSYYFNDELIEFFEPENVEDLAGKIVNLIRNPDRRLSLRNCGSRFIAGNNWDVKKACYFDLVDQLVSRTSGV
jgi:glycosyltransferase involved in cell wall biosynthesis